MPRISMLIPDDALALIDSVAENRTAFMVEAAVGAARRRRREIVDAEIADICKRNGAADLELAREFDATLRDGMDED